MIAYEKEALAKLAKLEALPNPSFHDLDAIPREYGSLLGHWRPFDYAKSQTYARRMDEGWRRLGERELEAAKDPQRQAQARVRLARNCEAVYWGAVAWLQPEAVGLFGEAVSLVQAAAADPGETAQILAALYRSHAETVFRLTGDTDAAAGLWAQHVEHAVNASGPRFGDPRQAPNPWTVDPMFRVP
jgi:hypothetical protein